MANCEGYFGCGAVGAPVCIAGEFHAGGALRVAGTLSMAPVAASGSRFNRYHRARTLGLATGSLCALEPSSH